MRHRPTRAPRLAAALAAAVVASLPVVAAAGTTGKIAGRVLDSAQRPIVAVTVAVVGQPLGAYSNNDGQYNILNVPPGTYELQISRIGYRALRVQEVVVSADQTTRVEVALEDEAIVAETVVVTAERPPVNVNVTSSVTTLQGEAIALLPVQELQDVVNLQAGVVDGHFRGGRLGEVQFQVDGLSVNNIFDNSSSLRIDRSLLQEVQVISGTFDAEYGQAMSGVVNAVLKDGGDRLRVDAEVFGGGFAFPGRDDDRLVADSFQPFAARNFTLTASGPLGLPKTVYLVNARRYEFDDYVRATRLFDVVPTYDEAARRLVPTPGDGEELALGWSREWTGALKITNRSIPNLKLSYQALANRIESRRSDYAFRYNPDGLPQQNTKSVAHGLDATYTFGKATYLDVGLRQNFFDYFDRAYEDVYDRRYDAAGPPVQAVDLSGVVLWGVDFTRFRQTTNTYLFKSTLVSQVTPVHQVKAGLDVQVPEVRFGTPGHLVYTAGETGLTLRRYLDRPPDWPALQRYWPVLGAAFVQDQMEWSDLTIRAGLRLDSFDARASLPSDLSNPANAIAGAPLSTPVRTSRKTYLSPRLGVAYPLTDRSGVHFAYGHSIQFPAIRDIFSNADYSVLARLQATTASYGRVMGNPDIEPETTVQYEFGYKQALSQDFGFDVSLFYKDIRDLLGVEFIDTYNDATYARLANTDFGNVTGFTVALDHRALGPASLSFDYTWQLARGNSSDPFETATRASAGEDPRPRVVPFNWDQRHTFNATLALADPKTYAVSLILRAGSGQPYTPVIESGFGYGLEANSGRKPFGAVVDLRAERRFGWQGQDLGFFGRVFNVFDSRFFNGGVFSSTGSPFYSRFPVADQVALANPTRFYAPRRVEIGLTMGWSR